MPAGPRSIPACAGEPVSPSLAMRPAQVYPRVCGGTISGGKIPVIGEGLSPRVRGNRRRRGNRRPAQGSIPACAGEPYAPHPVGCDCGVYPRVCGGTLRLLSSWSRRLGLSPRVRGNPAPLPHAARPRRSIPACAGEPSGGNGGNGVPAVYPRVCGGTPRRTQPRLPAGGLSPRVRGNLSR